MTIRRYTQCCQLALLWVALATCSYGQSHQARNPAPTAAAPDESSVGDLPTRELVFTAGDPVSGLKASPVIILPAQCSSDGALFVDMLQPPTFMQHAIYAVTQKSSRGFEVSAINDLRGINIVSFFPGNDHVSVMVHATREASPLPMDAKVRLTSYGYFLAIFNRQGRYLKSVELQLHDVLPSRVAELASGEYLVTGYDRANDLPRLYLIADDGQVIHSVVLPYTLGKYVPSSDPDSVQGMMNHVNVLGSIEMTAHQGEIVVWRRDASGPILGVGAHGSTREINLQIPKGLTLADVLPSDKLW